ncbi:hypothetical protein [Streptomyces sp. YKOK-I1]
MPPEYQPRTADTAIEEQASQFLAALDAIAAEQPTAYRDRTPPPSVGTAPPVPQPGRPPMSQRAVDASTLMLSAGVASLPVGAVTIGIMLASGHADPVVIAVLCAAPTTLVLAVARLVRRAKETVEAAPAVHHHHYSGPVRQEYTSVRNETRGFGRSTTNL